MKLAELEPEFLKITGDRTFRTDATIADCDGLMFLCPVCFKKNSGPVGTHRVICWKPHVPQTRRPKPGRWNILGTSFGDLTLQAGSSSVLLTSVLLTGGCKAHFFIRNGEIC